MSPALAKVLNKRTASGKPHSAPFRVFTLLMRISKHHTLYQVRMEVTFVYFTVSVPITAVLRTF